MPRVTQVPVSTDAYRFYYYTILLYYTGKHGCLPLLPLLTSTRTRLAFTTLLAMQGLVVPSAECRITYLRYLHLLTVPNAGSPTYGTIAVGRVLHIRMPTPTYVTIAVGRVLHIRMPTPTYGTIAVGTVLDCHEEVEWVGKESD